MLNRVILMGRLTQNPELRETPNNVPVLSFSIAVDRSFGREKQTDFINLVAWRQTADFIRRYFIKGQMIAIEGSLQSRRYTDKQGNNRTAYEVVVDQAHFAGAKRENAPVQAGQAAPAPQEGEAKAGDFKEPAQQGQNFSVGDFNNLEDFEEIGTDDADLPF